MTDFNPTQILPSAIALYKAGFNVFPVPSPKEVLATKKNSGIVENPYSKPPYKLEVVFNNRLHMCDEKCQELLQTKDRYCLPKHALFENLFCDYRTGHQSNLAVMLGRTSGNLVVLDCDSMCAFETVLNIIEKEGISHWAYKSFRGGGILLRIIEGEVKNLPKSLIEDVEIYGNRHFSVLPPSVHPSGVLYEWVDNPLIQVDKCNLEAVSIESLEWLGAKLVREVKNSDNKEYHEKKITSLDTPNWMDRLCAKSLEFILEGADLSERNNRLFAAACDMAGNKITYTMSKKVLLDACSKCNPPYPKLDAIRTIDSAFSTKREPAKEFQSSTDHWRLAIEFDKYFDWRQFGRTAQTDRKVFLAAIERAKMENRSAFRCTIREIAELSNLSIQTVITSLKRLSGNDPKQAILNPPSLLVLKTHNQINKSAIYGFSDEVLNFTKLDQYLLLGDDSVLNLYFPNPQTPAEKDVFKKVGIHGWRIWKYLLQFPPKTQKEIGIDLCIPQHTVRRALHKTSPLLTHHIVNFDPISKKYLARTLTEDEMEKIAMEMGTNGLSESMKFRHQRERELRANYVIGEIREKWLNRYWQWEQEQEGFHDDM